mmetsp:Transcript_61399/g.163322  ORF Transcript_61399/g.163322 Transcript_61399/m.163322 type:complete len:204 (+) Transcript_61399:1312-1923(+)
MRLAAMRRRKRSVVQVKNTARKQRRSRRDDPAGRAQARVAKVCTRILPSGTTRSCGRRFNLLVPCGDLGTNRREPAVLGRRLRRLRLIPGPSSPTCLRARQRCPMTGAARTLGIIAPGVKARLGNERDGRTVGTPSCPLKRSPRRGPRGLKMQVQSGAGAWTVAGNRQKRARSSMQVSPRGPLPHVLIVRDFQTRKGQCLPKH